MPSKFSCRQLRETGQSFESFLVVRGLDMETDRERLRTIYNRDFKIRYAPAHSPAQNRAPSLPPRSPRRGQPSRVGAERRSSPSGSGPSRGGADLPSRNMPTPHQRRPLCPGRAGPLRQVPAESLPLSPPPRRRGPGSRAWGRGSSGAGPGFAGARGASCLLVAASPAAGFTGTPAPLLRGCCFLRGPLSQRAEGTV